MIYINKNERNLIGLTLTESSTIEEPYYLFTFTPEWGIDVVEPIIFTAPDISIAKQRLNVFELIEGEEGITLKGGQYTYRVYESIEFVESVEETTGRIVEQGRMNVMYTEDEADQGQNNEINSVYK